jgi:hypothetical protein
VIKQSALFRERIVVGEVRRMLKLMELHASSGFPAEKDVLDLLAGRGERDLELPLVRFVMELLGAEASAPRDPRFDKNHRALNAQRLKGPRGGDGVEL